MNFGLRAVSSGVEVALKRRDRSVGAASAVRLGPSFNKCRIKLLQYERYLTTKTWRVADMLGANTNLLTFTSSTVRTVWLNH
jgi:hypothetical protein